MAELTAADVEQYSRGRLKAADAETARLLNGALAAARRACGWHVSPVRTETLELDGDGGRVLSLPSLKVIEITELVEDGVDVPVGDLRVSKRTGLVRKRGGGCWTAQYGAIEVTLSHGFTEAEGEDWRTAVLEATNRLAVDKFRGDLSVTRKRVDDVDVYWSERIVGEFETDPSLGRFQDPAVAVTVFGYQTVGFVGVTLGAPDANGVRARTRTQVDVADCRFRPLRVDEKVGVVNVAGEVWRCTAPPDAAVTALTSISELVYDGTDAPARGSGDVNVWQLIGAQQPFADADRAGVFKVTVLAERKRG